MGLPQTDRQGVSQEEDPRCACLERECVLYQAESSSAGGTNQWMDQSSVPNLPWSSLPLQIELMASFVLFTSSRQLDLQQPLHVAQRGDRYGGLLATVEATGTGDWKPLRPLKSEPREWVDQVLFFRLAALHRVSDRTEFLGPIRLHWRFGGGVGAQQPHTGGGRETLS